MNDHEPNDRCDGVRRQLLDFVEEPQRDVDAERRLWSHLLACPECSSLLDDLAGSWGALPPATEARPPADVRASVLQRARTPHLSSDQGGGPAPAPAYGRVAAAGVALVIATASLVLVATSRDASSPDGGRVFPAFAQRDVSVGDPMPSFAAIEIETGRPVSIEELRGRVVLLNLWATWCAPCESEMPSMERLHRELGGEGLTVVALSVDQESTHLVRDWVGERGLTFTVLHDRDGRFERSVQIVGVPETFVIGRDGRLVRHEIGPRQWDEPEFQAFFQDLLREGA